MEKKTDKKFVVGMIILAVMLLVMMGGFWTTVSRQAQLDAAKEQQELALSIRAICLQAGGGETPMVLWDMDASYSFEARMPSGVYNREGVLIKGDVLEYGDTVRIYGGDLTEGEGRPFLSGITKMERLGRSTLEEAQAYQEKWEAEGKEAEGDEAVGEGAEEESEEAAGEGTGKESEEGEETEEEKSLSLMDAIASEKTS